MQAASKHPAEHPEQRWGRGVGRPRVTHITLELILDRGLVKFIFMKGDKPNEKQLLSILTAGCLMAAMVPAAFAADANDLQAQIDAAEAGSTIKLNENTTITTPAEHQQEHYPDGNG